MELGNLVPQLFYDLISRVLPGAVTIFTLAEVEGRSVGSFASAVFQGSTALEESATAQAVLLFVASYLVGQLVSPVSDFIQWQVMARIFPSRFNVLRDNLAGRRKDYQEAIINFLVEDLGYEPKSGPEQFTQSQYTSAIFVWYDWARIRMPRVGARLAKLRAEYRMFSNLSALLFLVLLWYAVGRRGNLMDMRVAILVGAIGICSWGFLRSYWLFQKSTINNYAKGVPAVEDRSRGEQPTT